MDLEILFWGYIPILIGLLLTGGSFYLTVKKKIFFGLVASFLILALNGLAIYILAQIIAGAYPTFIPHILILFSAVLLLMQRYLMNKNKTFANNV